MTGARARGVVLYSLAAALLLAGAFWYVRAAPSSAGTAADPRVPGWRAAAGRLLPDLPQQVTAGTIVLSGGTSAQRTQAVTGGSYTLSMICLGDHGVVRVRLSGKGYDSGRAVPCAVSPQPVAVTVGLADQFYMLADAETDPSAAVFRWRLQRAGGF